MIHLISGGFGSGKTETLYAVIAETVKAKKRAFLFVPEQYTVESERRLSEILPPFAPLYFEVTNFSRFANTVFRRVGGLSSRYASTAAQRLLMWKTLSSLQEGKLLRETGEVEVGRVEKTLAALSELHAAAINATMLRTVSEQMTGNDSLRDRLHDYALIDSIYRGYIEAQYGDEARDLDALAEILRTDDHYRDTLFAFDGFTSLTEQEYRVVEALMPRSEIYLALSLPENAVRSLAYREIEGFAARIRKSAAKAGVKVDETICRSTNNMCVGTAVLAYITDNLWNYDESKMMPYAGVSSPDDVVLASAGDPYSAAEWLAADIRKRLMNGARCRDFAVIAGRAENYAGVLDEALKKNEIPFYMSTKVDIRELEAIKLIESLYAMHNRGYREKDVIGYLKCGMTDLDENERDILELYIARWRISGAVRYLSDRDFTMHPRGYDGKPSETDDALLLRINEAKKKLFLPIRDFENSLRTAETVGDHCKALVNVLLAVRLPEKLHERAVTAKKAGDTALAEQNERLFSVISDALDTLYETLADEKVTVSTFETLLRLLFGCVEIGRIPSSSDEVVIGDASFARVGSPKRVYLFGVNEGEFPPPVTDSRLFSDSERRLLEQYDLPLAPDLGIRSSHELFSFLRAFSSASEGITLLTMKADTAFRALSPSAAFFRVEKLAGDAADRVDVDRLPKEDFLYAAEAAAEKLGTFYRTPLYDPLKEALPDTPEKRRLSEIASLSVSEPECRLSPESVESVFGGKIVLTQSKMNSYADCPFGFFGKYVLKLGEDEPAEFGYAGIGNYIHDALDRLFTVLKERNLDIHTVSKEDMKNAVDTATARVEADMFGKTEPTPRLTHRIESLRKSARLFAEELRTEFSECAYRPVAFELPISPNTAGEAGAHLTPLSYRLDDGRSTVTVDGKIDRLDYYRSPDTGTGYLRVVDYKTGSKQLSLDKIDTGKDLQLFLYLLASCAPENRAFRRGIGIETEDPPLRAGLLYMNTSTKLFRMETDAPPETAYATLQKQIDRKGILLDDEENIAAMEPNGEKRYTPYSASGRNGTACLYTEEQFKEYEYRIEGVIRRMGNRLAGGNCDVSPLGDGTKNSACEYCKMKPFCRKV